MRSSVTCLPRGMLLSLALTPDLCALRAAVVYGQGVELLDAPVAHWVFWRIRRWISRDSQTVWSARAHATPEGDGAALALRVLDGDRELTAHQFKGLATALGIWGSLRRPPMLEHAGLFNRQATAGRLDATLAELLARDSHCGLPDRAAATGWNVGP